jgi:hypothetical protein
LHFISTGQSYTFCASRALVAKVSNAREPERKNTYGKRHRQASRNIIGAGSASVLLARRLAKPLRCLTAKADHEA